MSTPHSLPLSPSSKPVQLPFSPASSSHVSRFQLPPSPIKPQTFGGQVVTSPHNRSESTASKHTRAQRSESNPAEIGSPTHVGGILPSSSFLRASRPRPSTAESAESSGDYEEGLEMVHELPTEHFEEEQEKLQRQMSTSSRFSTLQKRSKEPLLPIGVQQTRSTTPVRHSFAQNAPMSGGQSHSVLSGQRESLDKILFKKRTSVDSRLAFGQTIPPDSPVMEEGSLTFEMRPSDIGRESPSFYGNLLPKPSPSPGPSYSVHGSRQHHTFTPTPPDNDQDLAHVPIKDERGRFVKRYTLHPSRNHFFFGGHLLTGGDSPWAFIFSLSLVFGITGVYFGTTCVWWWHNESPVVAAVGAYMSLLTISSMMATAFSDPGILPRDLDPDPPYPNRSPSDGAARAPLPRDLKVRAGIVRVKYCGTCCTYRPPRSSHCRMCDNCVDGCDHHCQWVNNCIGRRNYASFFLFLLSAVVTLVLIVVTSALHLYLLTVKENIDFKHAINRGIGSAVVFSLGILVVWPVTALLVYHVRLLVLNATTIEQIRNQAHKSVVSGPAPPNPFSHGSWRRNLTDVLGRPPGYSWLDSSRVATEDKREINPGILADEDESRGDRYVVSLG